MNLLLSNTQSRARNLFAFCKRAWPNELVTQASTHLKKIIHLVQQYSKSGSPCLCVFDLDSTLFDVSPRIQKILYDFSQIPEFQNKFPDSCKILESIKTEPKDWGVKDALLRAGLDGHHPDFHQCMKEFWSKTFFSNEYLQYDIPYAGAVGFVQELYQSGAKICYLSARDMGRMGAGSPLILKKWKFPLHDDAAVLALKPEIPLDDAQFKSDYFKMNKTKFKKTWFFENEPVNIELVRQQHPEIELVFFNSTHSRKISAPQDLPTIVHYLLD